ncbi:hypothetical protein [Sorangium sp. So ce1151]|uniref:hypothetical protein n=1 Tax=Sorangium sp. So ce1151 TaxID=3133332 RepID=UPI003F648463
MEGREDGLRRGMEAIGQQVPGASGLTHSGKRRRRWTQRALTPWIARILALKGWQA